MGNMILDAVLWIFVLKIYFNGQPPCLQIFVNPQIFVLELPVGSSRCLHRFIHRRDPGRLLLNSVMQFLYLSDKPKGNIKAPYFIR